MTYKIVEIMGKGPGLKYPGERNPYHVPLDNSNNWLSPCDVYSAPIILRRKKTQPPIPEVLIYTHDDLTIHDPAWLDLVLSGFNDSNGDNDEGIVAIGLGGATGLGTPDLYRKPYNIANLARQGYASNQTNAEVHGERFEGWRRVAVIEQFFMAVRTSFLLEIGGWPTKHLTHHCLDMWLACEAACRGKQIWMVGLSCTHHGGGTSTNPSYQQATWLQGGTMESDHQIPHRWIYDNYRDVLPISV